MDLNCAVEALGVSKPHQGEFKNLNRPKKRFKGDPEENLHTVAK